MSFNKGEKSDDDERRVSRMNICGAVALTGPSILPISARVIDVSEYGCRLSIERSINVGSFLTLTFEPSIISQGWVAWHSEGQIGIEFVAPMSSTAISKLGSSSS